MRPAFDLVTATFFIPLLAPLLCFAPDVSWFERRIDLEPAFRIGVAKVW